MESKETTLIARIKESNLAQSDKELLINILTDDSKDYDSFIKALIDILKLSKVALKLFDIDL